MECVDVFPFKRPYPYISFKCYGNMALYILNLYQNGLISKVKFEKESLFVTFYDYNDTHYVSDERYFPIINGETLIGTYNYDTNYIPGKYLAKHMYEVDRLTFNKLNMPVIEYSQCEHEYLAKRHYDEPVNHIEYTVVETDNSDSCCDEPAPVYFSDTSEED